MKEMGVYTTTATISFSLFHNPHINGEERERKREKDCTSSDPASTTSHSCLLPAQPHQMLLVPSGGRLISSLTLQRPFRPPPHHIF